MELQSTSEMLSESMRKCEILFSLEILLILDLKIEPEMAKLALTIDFVLKSDRSRVLSSKAAPMRQ